MSDANRQTQRRWAVLRIVLGMLQIIGAMTLMILLIASGVNALTLTVAGVMMLFVGASLVLFRAK
ncbi:MAG: hypothetical protein JWL69_2605 [Phycisphaerales bacterium]|jgi:hypothetical protein|nr:hypothetical protein [Phycisphaerales bacterium]